MGFRLRFHFGFHFGLRLGFRFGLRLGGRPRRLLLRKGHDRQDDPSVDRIRLQHLELYLLTLDEPELGIVVRLLGAQLTGGDESLYVSAEIDHDPLVHEAGHVTGNLLAGLVSLGKIVPRVLFRLLEAERDPLLLGIDRQNHDLDFLALAHHFRRVLHAAGPAHVGDVDEAVDTRLDLHECAERGEVANDPLDPRAGRILARKREPRVFLCLLHAERDLLLFLVHSEDHTLDLVPDADQLGRVSHVPGPAHLRDVDEALDALLQLDEGAVVRDGDDPAAHADADRVLGGHVLPRVWLELFESKRNALAIPIDIQDLHLDLLADLTHLGWMAHAPPGHVRDMEKPVHSAEIDEGAEVGNVLNDSGSHLGDRELFLQLVALPRSLLLEDHPPTHDDVTPPFVELEDLEIVLRTDQLLDVVDPAQGDLGAGQEGIHSHEVYGGTSLDLPLDHAGYGLVVVERGLDLLPDAEEVGLLLGQDDDPLLILQALEEHFDLVARMQLAGVAKLIERHRAFRFEADVEDRRAVRQADDRRLHDLALGNLLHRLLVHGEHLVVLLGGVLAIVERIDRGR